MCAIQLQCILFIPTVMFITNEAHRSKFSSLIGGPQQSHWMAIELALSHPWFIVSFKERETAARADSEDYLFFKRTMLVDSIASVEQLIHSDTSGLVKFESVQICTPGYMNGTNGWKVEILDSVQEVHHPDFDGHAVDMFVTSEGHKYSHFMSELPLDQVSPGEIRFKAPCPLVDQL